MKVFGTSIRDLRNHLFLTFTERGIEIEPEHIRWVLTVPASAKILKISQDISTVELIQ
jgi:hypothetical protein